MIQRIETARLRLLYGICLPLAAFLGYLLTAPADAATLLAVGMVICVLAVPVLLEWHHAILILTWNSVLTAFIFPAQPPVWILMGGISLAISVVNRTLENRPYFFKAPSLNWSILVLLATCLATALATGGIGFQALGHAMQGGRRYVLLAAAVIGYFALIAQPVNPRRAMLLATLFFLSGITAAISNLVYEAGPSFWVLFYLFPVEWAEHHVRADLSMQGDSFVRLSGIAQAAIAILSVLLLRWGFRGVLDVRRPWRALVLLGMIALSLLGGFRSSVVLLGLLLGFQFFFEGLHRTRYFPILLAAGLGLLVAIHPWADRLPLPVQRALSILPLDVDPAVRRDAQTSTEWRLEMWRVLLPEVPKHLLLGKGYSVAAVDLYLTEEAVRRGISQSYEQAIVAGNYHSGPLSVLLPFGLPGAVAFLWFLGAAWLVLWRNHKYGDPSLARINTFLLAFFTARAAFFFLIFGSLYSDLLVFAGVAGLSISINQGVRQRPVETPLQPSRFRSLFSASKLG